MKTRRRRLKVMRWRDEVKARHDLAAQVAARLQGKVWRVFVLARSHRQFDRWCEGELEAGSPARPDSDHHPIFVQDRNDLLGVHLNAAVQLVELPGWEDRADDALKYQVRLLEATAAKP